MLPHIHYLSFIKKNKKSNIGWPQQPLTEKMLKFNMIFYDTVKTFLFSNHQNQVILVFKLLNSRTWITLKSSEGIFQARSDNLRKILVLFPLPKKLLMRTSESSRLSNSALSCCFESKNFGVEA